MALIQILTRSSRLPTNPISLPDISPLHTTILSIFHIKIQNFTTVSLHRTEDPIGFSANGYQLHRTEDPIGFSANGYQLHRFRFCIPMPSLRRSVHGVSVEAKIPSESEVEKPPDTITEQARLICKLVSAHPKTSEIEKALGSFGAKVEVSPLLVLEVLRLLNNAGNLALGFFRWAQKQRGFNYTPETYNALIDSLGKIRQFDAVQELVESMSEKGLLTKDTFMIIISRYAKAKKISEAVETFEEMEMFGLKPDLSDFNRFLNALSYSGQIKVAHQLFDKMKKIRFSADQKTYNILLKGWGEEPDFTMLEAVYSEMRNEGFEPDAVSYGIIISAYSKARQMDKAIEVFHRIQNPTPRIYCALISALGSQGRMVEALKFLKISRASSTVPEAQTYNAIVRSYCSALRFDDAYWVIDEMRRLNVGPTSRTYDLILHHLVKARRTKEAYAFFQRIMNNEQDCGANASTYAIIVRMFCNLGKPEKAVEVWDQMMAKGILADLQMFSLLICGLCRERKFTEACKYFQDMLDMGIDPPTQLFQTLRDYLLGYGMKDVVFRFSQRLEKMRKARLVS